LNGRVGQHQLKSGVINAREVARPRGLVLFRAEGKRVNVDPSVRVAGVVLVGLDEVKVGTFTLREPVLTVKLQLGSNDGVLTPAVEVEGRFGKNEGSGIRHTRSRVVGKSTGVGGTLSAPVDGSTGRNVNRPGVIEETRGRDEITRDGGSLTTERHDGVREGVNPVRVVEGLGAERAVQDTAGSQRRAVVDVGIGLHHPDQLLTGVVEVELDLVGGRPDGFITSELKLFNQVFMGVLRHAAALIRVQEDVVDVEGGGNERLVVGAGHSLAATAGRSQVGDGPQALINRADVEVDLDFVVLKGNEGESQTGVSAVPELEGDIEGGFREGVTGLAHLDGSRGGTGTINRRERGVGNKCKLGSITDHLEVTTLLFLGEGKLVPQVHPVTILSVNALSTDFNFNLGNHLLPREVEPTSPDTSLTGALHALVNFRESDLQVCAVSQITVSADGAGHTATKISLSVKSLLNGFHREVRVATVSHLPESNLRVTRQVDILCAVSY